MGSADPRIGRSLAVAATCHGQDGGAAPIAPPALDFTPRLAELAAEHGRSGALPEGARVVLCLGSRAQISFLLGHRCNDGLIIGAATTEVEGLELVERLRPDLLFASDALEEGCGMALVLAVKQRLGGIRTLLMISTPQHRPRIRTVIEAGCEGILLEARMELDSALEAIRTVCAGGLHHDRALALPAALAGGRQGQAPRRGPPLSPREQDVLARLVRGESNAEIAAHLFVSVDTVKTHLSNLLLKLKARDRTHAAVLGLQYGLVDWPGSRSDR
jgi:DNA-binding NarL/FixJ family response regulator